MSICRRSLTLFPVAAALALAPAAAASTSTQGFTAPGEHTLVVPAGVTSVNVTLVGAGGGWAVGGAVGGAGATFGATLAVTPGETLYAEVGGNGTPAVAGTAFGLGGSNGGAGGGRVVFLFAAVPGGGGGGGASDVRTCPLGAAAAGCAAGSSLASRLAVAGGGAGGGGAGDDASAIGTIHGGAGGYGGGPGAWGQPDPHGDTGGQPGQPGDQSSGGAPGANSEETQAAAGQLGVGGGGGSSPSGGGGGGGGGLYGGGGGAGGSTTVVDPNTLLLATSGGGGGGGGSSGVPSTATGVSSAAVHQTAPGAVASVTFDWTDPAPAVSTAAPASITAGAATLGGSVNPNGSGVTDCHFELTPAPAGGADVPCAQQIGSGMSPVTVSANAAGLKGATTYRYTLVASSSAGSTSSTAAELTTPADAAPQPGNGTPGPALTALKLSPARFRVHTGTTIAFTLSRKARVTISFERRTGRRFVRVRGALRLTHGAGGARVRFAGRVAGRKLAPGSYRVSAVAVAGGHASKVRRARATVVR